jgi:O-antigen/teichoic acid export membrane protein
MGQPDFGPVLRFLGRQPGRSSGAKHGEGPDVSSDAVPPFATRTAAGAAWLVGAKLFTRGIDLVGLLILARILSPADFGLVAIAMTPIFIVEAVLEMPLIQSLVRLPRLKRDHFDTAFTLSVLRGLALAIVLAILARPFASLYGDPRLAGLIMALSMAPAVRGMMSPRMAVYIRAMSFQRDFWIDAAGKLVSLLVSSQVAFATGSYWAIAAGTISGPVVMTGISYLLAPYRPRFSLRQWHVFSDAVRWTSAAQVITAINWQCDRLLLGRLTSPAQLGAYSMATDLTSVPEQALIKPVVRPLLSAFSHIGDDLPRLRIAYAKASSTVLTIGLPIMVGMALLAEPVVRLMFGETWRAATPVLQWLPLSIIPSLLVAPLGPLAMALNQTQTFFRLSLVEFCVKPPLVLIGAIGFAVVGVVAARLAASFILAVVAMLFVRQLIAVSVREQVRTAWRTLASGAVMALFVLLARPWLDGLEGLRLAASLVLLSGAAAAIYGGAMLLGWRAAGFPPGVEALLVEYLDRAVHAGLRRVRKQPLG